jgi:hypothetical protein
MHHNIKLLLTASVLIHSGVNLMAPVYAIFLSNINGTLLETGLAVGIYTILKGFFFLKFADIKPEVISHRTMMMSGYAMMGAVYLFYPGVTAVWQVFILQSFLSFSESIITPSWSASIAVSLEEGSERKTYSNFYGYRSLFEGAAAIIGGYIAMELGFAVIFFIMAGFALASSIVVSFLHPEENDQS